MVEGIAKIARRLRAVLLLSCFVLGFSGPTFGAPGDMDAAFGASGLAGTLTTGLPTTAKAVLVQVDPNNAGVYRTIVASTVAPQLPSPFTNLPQFDYRIVVARYTAAGALDTTFGNTGTGTLILPALPAAYPSSSGPRDVRMTLRPDFSGNPVNIVVAADVGGGAPVVFELGANGAGADIQRNSGFPGAFDDEFRSIGGVWADADNVFAAGVIYRAADAANRAFVMNMTSGAAYIVPSLDIESVTGMVGDGAGRLYVAATIPDVANGPDPVLIAVKQNLSELDAPGFAGSGYYRLAGPEYRSSASVAITTGGVVLGIDDPGVGGFGALRLTPDGVPDTSFGTTGLVVSFTGETGPIARAVAVDGTDKITVIGDAGGKMRYARFAVNGTELGVTAVDFPVTTASTGTSIHAAGAGGPIALAGSVTRTAGTYATGVTLINEDGTVVNGFNSGGFRVDDLKQQTLGATMLGRQSTGAIVTGGVNCETDEAVYPPTKPPCSIVLARYAASGVLDGAFGTSGIARQPLAPPSGSVDLYANDPRMVVDSLNRIYIVFTGTFTDVSSQGIADIAVMRFLPNGTLDATYGSAGLARIAIGPNTASEYVGGQAVDSQDRLVIAATAYVDNSGMSKVIAMRVGTSGSLDAGFGSAGIYTFPDIAPTNDARAYGLAIAPGDKPLLSGTFRDAGGNFRPLALRLTSAGGLDTAFNGTGVVNAFPDGRQGIFNEVDIDSSGRALLSTLQITPGFRSAVSRLRPDGSYDPLYGDCGVGRFDSYAAFTHLAADAPGNALLSYTNWGIARMTPVGAVDRFGFGTNNGFAFTQGLLLGPLQVYVDAGNSNYYSKYHEPAAASRAVVQPDGNILFAIGNYRSPDGAGMLAARLIGGSAAPTPVTLTASQTTVPVNTTVTLTADMGAGAGGNARFRFACGSDGTQVAVDGTGKAQLAHLFNVAGTFTVSTLYEGDATHPPGIALVAVTVTGGGTPTTTTLSSSANPAVFGQTVNLTATVSGASPTGTVTFKEGPTVLGTQALAGGTATLPLATLSIGTHGVTAEYGGDTTYAPSASALLTQTINKAATTTALTSGGASVFGQTVTLTAKVGATAPGAGPYTGSVEFRDGATVLGTVSVDSAGVATLDVSSLSVATHALSAVYAGSGNHLTSTGNLAQTVSKAATTTTLATSPNPSTYGQTVSINVATTANAPGGGTPSGQMVIKSGAVAIDTNLAYSGGASVPYASLAAGSHTLTAEYSLGASHLDSSSPGLAHTVNQAVPAMTLGALPSPAVVLQNVLLAATVPKAGSGVVPTGSVTFKDGAATLGTVALAAGVATLTTPFAAAGVHSLTADYSGDGNYAATSASFPLTVNLPGAPVLAIVSGTPQIALAGSAFAAPLRVKLTDSIGNPLGSEAVTFMANAGATSGASATLLPSSLHTLADGSIEAAATANAFGGVYTVLATHTGSGASVTFNLTNVVQTATAANGVTISLSGPAGATLAQVTAVTPPLPTPPNSAFPFGLTGFVVEGLSPGASVQVTASFASVAGVTYYKYLNGGYLPMPGAVITPTTATFTLIDGGQGDGDGVVDGRIVDPGGIATTATTATTPVLTGVRSRKAHGGAGTYDLPLSSP